jgi:outer membrane protein assembly factor BamB
MCRPLFQAYLLLSTLLLVGCAQASSASLTPTPTSSSNASTLAQPTASSPLCQGHNGGTSFSQPVAPSSVYSGSADGTVWALDAESGAVRWRVQLADVYDSTVVGLEAGVVYVHANDTAASHPFLDALRASDGVLLWHQTLASDSAVAAVSQGAVYVTFGAYSTTTTTPSAIEARRAQDGTLLWHTQLEGTGPPQVRLDQGTLYVTSFSTLLPGPGWYYATTQLDALNASTGAPCWHSVLARTNTIAMVAMGQVYLLDTGTDVACEPRRLHVLDARAGGEQWHTEGSFLELVGVEQELASVEAVPQGCVTSRPFEQGVLSALHTMDGSHAWQSTIPFGPGAIANGGVLYVPSEDGDLAAYRAGNGVRLWRAQGEGGGLDLFDGVLYTSIEGRGFDALSPATGALEWRYQTPDGVGVSAVAHGRLYGEVAHITSGTVDNAIVALSAVMGKLLWRVEIGAPQYVLLVG